MFRYTGALSRSFTLNLGELFDTSKVTNMNSMFYSTGNYTSGKTLDLSTFDFSSVTSYNDMFYNTYSNDIIYVKDAAAQSWILTYGGNSYLTASNVLIKGT